MNQKCAAADNLHRACEGELPLPVISFPRYAGRSIDRGSLTTFRASSFGMPASPSRQGATGPFRSISGSSVPKKEN